MCEKKPVGLSVMGTYPVPPVRCSFFQKMKRAMSPSQKTGAEIPNSTKPIAARSATDCRLTADEDADRHADDEPDGRRAHDEEERARCPLLYLAEDRTLS